METSVSLLERLTTRPTDPDWRRMFALYQPLLRAWALRAGLGDADADDLVQDTLVRAVAKQHLWQEGTNLRAWLFTLMHNQHVNDVRRNVRTGQEVEIDSDGAARTEIVSLLQRTDIEADARIYNDAYDRLKQMVAEIGAVFIDLRGCLDGMNFRQYLVSPVDWHFSGMANERIGTAIARKLLLRP